MSAADKHEANKRIQSENLGEAYYPDFNERLRNAESASNMRQKNWL